MLHNFYFYFFCLFLEDSVSILKLLSHVNQRVYSLKVIAMSFPPTCLLVSLPMAEITKLPCFVVDIPVECMREWRQRYEDYREEMKAVLDQCGEGKDDSANEVLEKYKKVRSQFKCIF